MACGFVIVSGLWGDSGAHYCYYIVYTSVFVIVSGCSDVWPPEILGLSLSVVCGRHGHVDPSQGIHIGHMCLSLSMVCGRLGHVHPLIICMVIYPTIKEKSNPWVWVWWHMLIICIRGRCTYWAAENEDWDNTKTIYLFSTCINMQMNQITPSIC